MKSQEMIPGWIGGLLESGLILLSFSFFAPVMLLAVNAQRGAEHGKFLLVGGAALAIGTLISAILSRRIGRPRAVSMVAVFLMWFFTWSQLDSLGSDIPFLQPMLRTLVPILALVFLLGAAYKLGERQEFRLSLLVAGVALVLTPVWTLVRWYSGESVEVAFTGQVEVEEGGTASRTSTCWWLTATDGPMSSRKSTGSRMKPSWTRSINGAFSFPSRVGPTTR